MADQRIGPTTLVAKGRVFWQELQPNEDLDGPMVARFRARQVQALLSAMPLIGWANVVNVITVCWTLSGHADPVGLVLWSVMVLLGAVGATLLWRSYVQPGTHPMVDFAQARQIAVHVGVYGLLWVSLPLLTAAQADPDDLLLLATLSVGMTCAGAFLLSPLLEAALVHVAVNLSAALMALYLAPVGDLRALGLMLVAYAVIMVGIVVTHAHHFMGRLRAEAEIERQKHLVDLLLSDFEEHASDCLWEIDAGGQFRHVSTRLAQMFGVSSRRLRQSSFMQWLTERVPTSEAASQDDLKRLLDCLHLGEPFRELSLPIWTGHQVRWWSFSAKPLFDERGRPSGWRGVGRDVTQTRKSHEELTRLANQDVLTGLANRHRFSTELARQARGEERTACSLLFIDLDNFKEINDARGHVFGDQLLRILAGRLKTCVPDGDMLARLGGDQFALLSWRYAEVAEAEALAQQLQTVIGEPLTVEGIRLHVHASLGIAIAPRDGKDPQDLLRCADLALGAAKAAGRGCWRHYQPALGEYVQARGRLLHELGEALLTEQFTLYLQPQLALDSGEVTGFEALVRWQHSERGLVGPSEFIHVAEETGQIVPLGTWVLREACRMATAWPSPLRVAVNLSAVQFRSAEVVAMVDKALHDSGLAPERLELEITESTLIEDHDEAQATLHALRTRGIRVAMDDFGTGYSSLAYLRRFPLDKLKIDGQFVRSLASDAGAQAVVTAIIDLARALKLDTTAEGVETPEQWSMLRALGCDQAQGFLVARPMPSEDVPVFLVRAREEQWMDNWGKPAMLRNSLGASSA